MDLSPTVTTIALFTSVKDALEEGFTVSSRTADGYVVVKRLADGWVIGLIELVRHETEES